jgi:hypothetical protein
MYLDVKGRKNTLMNNFRIRKLSKIIALEKWSKIREVIDERDLQDIEILLRCAIKERKYHIVKELLNHQPELNITRCRNILLLMADYMEDNKMMKILLADRRINPPKKDPTMFMDAIENGEFTFARLIYSSDYVRKSSMVRFLLANNKELTKLMKARTII